MSVYHRLLRRIERKWIMQYERLFTPITIKNMTLKNRIVMPAMHHLYTENGYATDRFNQYYWKRAEGGAAMVIVGACRFDDYGARESCMSLRTDGTIPGWKAFTDGMHQRDCKVAVQLYHAGRYMAQKDVIAGGSALAPSAVYSPFTRETAPEMTLEQIKQVIGLWAQGAIRAREAGFDAVEILGSAGYLISQFLSPVTNLRTDEYGGSAQNRRRFPLEVIRAVRQAVGEDYPLIFRLGGNDFIPGSNTGLEAADFAKLAEQAGIDLFNVTGGWHETKVPQLTGDVPPGGLSYLAQNIKQSVSVPVILCNRINGPSVAELNLALGRADLVGMARPLLADPDLPIKAKSGKAIRPCVACNEGCLAKTFFDKPIECLVNGLCGREYQIEEKPAARPENLLVVGGGPAGCEFAIRASGRNHRVTLWEQENELGGQLRLAAQIPSRGEFKDLIGYYETKLRENGVTVVLGKRADAKSVLAGGFDRVIIAAGGTKNPIPLPEKTGCVPVYDYEQVLLKRAFPGGRVAVIGGSYIGCEVARYLAREGSLSPDELFYLSVYHAEKPDIIQNMLGSTDRKIWLLEKRPKIGTGYEPGTAWPVMADLDRLGVKRYPNTKVIEIGEYGVIAESTDKQGVTSRLEFPCDSVVMVRGIRPGSALQKELESLGVKAELLGNAKSVGKAIDAIREAAELGCRI